MKPLEGKRLKALQAEYFRSFERVLELEHVKKNLISALEQNEEELWRIRDRCKHLDEEIHKTTTIIRNVASGSKDLRTKERIRRSAKTPFKADEEWPNDITNSSDNLEITGIITWREIE